MLHVAAMIRRSRVAALLVAIHHPHHRHERLSGTIRTVELRRAVRHPSQPPGHGGPLGGENVSQAARFPHGECFPPPFPTP